MYQTYSRNGILHIEVTASHHAPQSIDEAQVAEYKNLFSDLMPQPEPKPEPKSPVELLAEIDELLQYGVQLWKPQRKES